MAVKVGQIQIRSGAFIAGLIVVVLGALMMAEGVVEPGCGHFFHVC